MERTSIHLLVLLLAFSHFISCSISIPSTRTQKLVQQVGEVPMLPNAYKGIKFEDEDIIQGRMDFEKEDYPGSGANDRHTPKPPE